MIFFSLFFLSWTLQAIFCGFAIAFAVDENRTPAQRLVPVGAALVTLICTALFLLDQSFFHSLLLNFGVSAADLLLLFASLVLYWRKSGPLNEAFRFVTLLTFLTSLLSFTGTPSSLFLAVLFFPNAQILTYHLWGGGAFLAIMLLTWLVVGLTLMRHRPSVAPTPAPNRTCGRISFVMLGVLGVGLLLALFYAPPLQTTIILQKRQHTMDLFHTMIGLAIKVKTTDYGRTLEGKSSIYPADVGAKSGRDYIQFLLSNGYLKQPLTLDSSEIEIGNVSRSDPDTTIFVRSTGTQYDIHTMIDNIGGVPNYAHGFLNFDKNGKGQFYRDERRGSPDLGTEPPRTPAFLPN